MSQPYLFFNKIRDDNTSALQKSKYTLWLSIQNLNLHSSNRPGVAQDVALQNSAPWPEHKVKKKKKKKSAGNSTQGTIGYGLTFFYLMPASLNAKCDPGYLIVTGCVKLELQCLNRWWSCLASFPSVFWYMQLFLLFTC